jgi:hypothetical protein
MTREELEDILNNKPYGFGKQFMKKDGPKKFTFKAVPFVKVFKEPISISAYGKTQASAFEAAKNEFYRTNKNEEYHGIEWTNQV